MPPVSQSNALAILLESLDGLDAPADEHQLKALLDEVEITLEDVCDHAEFAGDCYARNLVSRSPHYELLVLCWRSGQRSVIHDHAGSVCGFKVLRGTATETTFVPTECGGKLVKPVRSIEHKEGEVVVSVDADIHQVSNFQPAGEDLVTMHIYTPPLDDYEQFHFEQA